MLIYTEENTISSELKSRMSLSLSMLCHTHMIHILTLETSQFATCLMRSMVMIAATPEYRLYKNDETNLVLQ